MDGLCNTAQILCTRCQDTPRLPRQRWCRSCLTSAQRERRAAQRLAQADDLTVPVTQAAIPAMSHVPQDDGWAAARALPEALPVRPDTPQPAEASSPPRSAYHAALQAYESLRQMDGTRPAVRYPALYRGLLAVRWLQVERAYQQCHACGVIASPPS